MSPSGDVVEKITVIKTIAKIGFFSLLKKDNISDKTDAAIGILNPFF